MRVGIPVVFGMLMTIPAAAPPSQSTECYSIKRRDMQLYCLATTSQSLDRCHLIQNADAKNYCLATVGQRRDNCHHVRDNDLKYLCLATVPARLP